MTDPYFELLARKAIGDPPTGIENPPPLPSYLFPFQRDIVTWALRRGRAALFEGTGLGKTGQSLAWADIVSRHTGKPVLYLNPLAVSAQCVREADKFGIAARQVNTHADVCEGVNVTNYQKLQHFDMNRFGGVVLGEASILKNESGKYRTDLIEACKDIPFRLSETATPAPNDYMELGNQAEFLGVMSYTDMLATFFTHDGSDTAKWVLKGHAASKFWEWMASWSVLLRKPSDLGYADDGYNLPSLQYHVHGVDSEPVMMDGELFASVAVASSLKERQTAKRETIAERVAEAARVTPDGEQFVWWCHQNAESEALVKAIPGAVEVRGSDSEASKEQKLIDFTDGKIRVLVTKPSICGFGMNWQHCPNTGFVGLNDSWEQFYQAVRRFWRFGQTQVVNVHIIAAKAEGASIANIKRKEADAESMALALVEHTKNLSSRIIRGSVRDVPDYNPDSKMEVPSWL